MRVRREHEKSWAEVYVALITLLTWLAFGTFMFHWLEDWTRIQAFYFSVVSITTVGYGDLTPTSDLSRLFTAIYILIGVSLGLVTLGIIGSRIFEYRLERYWRNKQDRK